MFVHFRLPALQDVANQPDLDDATKRQKQAAQTPVLIFRVGVCLCSSRCVIDRFHSRRGVSSLYASTCVLCSRLMQ